MTASRISLLAVLAALLGGAAAVGIAAVVGVGGDSSTTTTVIQQSPVAGSASPASDGRPITARDIYRLDAPGVVFITAHVSQSNTSSFGFPQTERGVA